MAAQRMQWIVFSDLDATLLDHNTYSFAAAQPALERLAALEIPVILNSSKTCPEMLALRHRMGNVHPFIIENGAAAIIPAGYFGQADEERLNFSTEYTTILKVLDVLREQGYRFRNFAALDAADVSALTGLDMDDAAMAKARFASEPLLWDDTEHRLQEFKHHIEQQDLKLIKGGRFYHVTGLFDKSTAIQNIVDRYHAQDPDCTMVSIGLGDSPNDLAMLETVDIPVVIKSARSNEMQLRNPNAIFSVAEGPQGWNEAILNILKKYGL